MIRYKRCHRLLRATTKENANYKLLTIVFLFLWFNLRHMTLTSKKSWCRYRRPCILKSRINDPDVMMQEVAVRGGNLYITNPHLTIAFGRVDMSRSRWRSFLKGNLNKMIIFFKGVGSFMKGKVWVNDCYIIWKKIGFTRRIFFISDVKIVCEKLIS